LQGTDVAIQLLDEFERKLLPNITNGLSVENTNERAINFYKKMALELKRKVIVSIY